MKVVKYYCDHCGKQIYTATDYVDEDIGILAIERMDLCVDCARELDSLIMEFCKKRVKEEE